MEATHPPTLRESIMAAAAALKGGGLAVIPTETVYGVAARASRDGLARLAAARRPGLPVPSPATWHAPSRARVQEAIALPSPLHQRALATLIPGPVRLVIELDPARLAAAREALGVEPDVIDHAGALALRVPDNAVACDVLTRAGVAVIAERAGNFGLGDGGRLGESARAAAAALGAAAVVDDGPTRFGTASATVRLLREGGYRIDAPGAWSEDDVRARVERTILFVCTGNTCRSPMAAAIARNLLAQRPALPPGQARVPVRVLSAGVSATAGAPMTPEAAAALRALGVDPGQHRSRGVQAEEILRAQAVFAMTRSHARALESITTAAKGKVRLLDPAGTDIQDPIGGGAEVYRQTAQALTDMIRQRLAELERSSGEGSTP